MRAGGSLRRSARYVVHRIDRDTSGLVLFALSPAARDDLKAQFERRSPERIYLAVVNGHPEPESGTWRDKLVWDKERLVQKRAHLDEERAKDAEARYRVLEQFEWQSLIEVSLITGKRNQIRVQAGARGYPLVGERLYRFGRPRDERGSRHSRDRRCTPRGSASCTRPRAGGSSSRRRCRRTWRG